MNFLLKLVPLLAIAAILSGCAADKRPTKTTTTTKTARYVPAPPAEGPDDGPINADENGGPRRHRQMPDTTAAKY